MRTFLGYFAGALQKIFDHTLDGAAIHSLATRCKENSLSGIFVCLISIELVLVLKVMRHSLCGAISHGNNTLFSPFTQYFYLIEFDINVFFIKMYQLAETNAGAIKKFEDSTILGRTWSFGFRQLHHPPNIVGRDRFGQRLILFGSDKQVRRISLHYSAFKTILEERANSGHLPCNRTISESPPGKFSQPKPYGQPLDAVDSGMVRLKMSAAKGIKLLQIILV